MPKHIRMSRSERCPALIKMSIHIRSPNHGCVLFQSCKRCPDTCISGRPDTRISGHLDQGSVPISS